VPDGMARYIEREVNNGQYASTSDFFRQLVREYQAKAADGWLETVLRQRRDTSLAEPDQPQISERRAHGEE
jgi:Arc/MetJ-type ribon-helix-helix transcriptional regulator